MVCRLHDGEKADTSNIGTSIIKTKLKRYISIFVKMFCGKKISLKIEQFDTIGKIKNVIQEKEGIPPEHQCLFFASKKLHDDLLMNNLKNNTTLQLTLSLQGGIENYKIVKTTESGKQVIDISSRFPYAGILKVHAKQKDADINRSPEQFCVAVLRNDALTEYVNENKELKQANEKLSSEIEARDEIIEAKDKIIENEMRKSNLKAISSRDVQTIY